MKHYVSFVSAPAAGGPPPACHALPPAEVNSAPGGTTGHDIPPERGAAPEDGIAPYPEDCSPCM